MDNNSKGIWEQCLKLIQDQLPPKTFSTWFLPIKPLQYNDGMLTIQVASHVVRETLEERFIDVLGKALRSIIGPKARLQYQVFIGTEPTNIISTPTTNDGGNTIMLPPGQKAIKNPFEQPAKSIHIDSQLNPLYTMENFIEGECNRLARNAGLAIAQSPGRTAFNPLLIYGGSGLGKTHLAQAIALEVKQNFPDKCVLYVSTNLFQTQFTEAVRKNEINDFLHFYQLIDLLILDDIHELAGKTATQNTFFHIFNHLQQKGKQLILTCDRPPAELSGIEERLLTRFKWGLTAEIKTPDFQTRKNIFLYKAKKDGIEFDPGVVDYVCSYVNNNVRELEGTMISLLAQATFNRKELTVDLAKEILGTVVKRTTTELTLDKIQQVVCEHFNIEPNLLQSRSRKSEVVNARHLTMYFCKAYTKSSLAYIGNQLGKKNHATVLYACRVVTDRLETDKEFKLQFEEIQKKLYTGCLR